MKATYEKVNNLIVVELNADEVQKYLSQKLSKQSRDLRQRGQLYYLTIPCTGSFYQKTQRQPGGEQEWEPEQLRQAVRASVANNLVPYTGSFKEYKSRWNSVFQGLLRNIRLKFPSKKHPAVRLSYSERQFRERWRKMHGVKPA